MHLSDFASIKTDRDRDPSQIVAWWCSVNILLRPLPPLLRCLWQYVGSQPIFQGPPSPLVCRPTRLSSSLVLSIHGWDSRVQQKTTARTIYQPSICLWLHVCLWPNVLLEVAPPPLPGTMCWHAPKPCLLPPLHRHSQHLPVIISSPKMYQVLFG